MQPYIPIHLTQLVKGKLGAVAKAISFISNRQTGVAPYHHTLSCLRKPASTRCSDPVPSRCEGSKVIAAPRA